MPKNVLETEVLSLAGNHSGGQSSEKFLELSFSHTCWFSEYVAWLWKHSVHQHHCASDDQLQFMPRCTTEWVCRPWEVRALCLGRSEGRAGIGILSRPSLVESEIWRLLLFDDFISQTVFLQPLSSVCLQTNWNFRLMALNIFFSNWFWVGMTHTSI